MLRIHSQFVTSASGNFLQQVRDALGRRVPATLHDEGAQRAAVALVVTAGADPALLFVKRRERTGDPWSGHAAFPGGYRSTADQDLLATAERETEEETGLALATVGQRLGRLDDVYPRSIMLPKVIVTPCVFAVEAQLPVTPSNEIERALWLPLDQLRAPENRQSLALETPLGRREFESIRIASLTIWGLTERVLAQFIELIGGGQALA